MRFVASSPPDVSEQRLCGSIAPEAVLAPTPSRTSSKSPAMGASLQDTDISYEAQPAAEEPAEAKTDPEVEADTQRLLKALDKNGDAKLNAEEVSQPVHLHCAPPQLVVGTWGSAVA